MSVVSLENFKENFMDYMALAANGGASFSVSVGGTNVFIRADKNFIASDAEAKYLSWANSDEAEEELLAKADIDNGRIYPLSDCFKELKQSIERYAE